MRINVPTSSSLKMARLNGGIAAFCASFLTIYTNTNTNINNNHLLIPYPNPFDAVDVFKARRKSHSDFDE